MYGALRAWLKGGAIPNDPDLKRAMLAIRYSHNIRDEIILESKEDMLDDPNNSGLILDDLDALALTFAYPLAAHARAGGEHPHAPVVEFEYNPYSEQRMSA